MSEDQTGDETVGGRHDDRRDDRREDRREDRDGRVDDVLSDDELALLLAAPELWSSPSDGLEDRIVAAIAAERDSSAMPAAAIPAPGDPAPGDPAPGIPASGAPVVRLDEARRRRQRWLVPGAAALVGAAAAALITVAVVPRDDETEPTADATIQLVGSDLAADVTGTAEVTTEASGVRIVIRAPGLPRREGGEFYQGWLKDCASTELIPIGSFHELDEAIGWAGIDVATHPLLTVTRERVAAPKDPAQGSSGEVVVSGALAPCPGT